MIQTDAVGVVLKDDLSYSVSLGREHTLIIHIGRSEPQSQQENATVDTIWPVCDPPPLTLLNVCHLRPLPQLGRYTKEGQLFLGPLGSTGEDTRCVVDDQIGSFPQLLNCEKVTNVKQKTWHFSQVRKRKKTVVSAK